jgi:hypothetical protein
MGLSRLPFVEQPSRRFLTLPAPSVPTISEHVATILKHTPNPDPAIAPDAGQFIRVELLDHIEQCSEDDCHADTRISVQTHDAIVGVPYCNAHAHVLFADWMVGA